MVICYGNNPEFLCLTPLQKPGFHCAPNLEKNPPYGSDVTHTASESCRHPSPDLRARAGKNDTLHHEIGKMWSEIFAGFNLLCKGGVWARRSITTTSSNASPNIPSTGSAGCCHGTYRSQQIRSLLNMYPHSAMWIHNCGYVTLTPTQRYGRDNTLTAQRVLGVGQFLGICPNPPIVYIFHSLLPKWSPRLSCQALPINLFSLDGRTTYRPMTQNNPSNPPRIAASSVYKIRLGPDFVSGGTA
jgi:hypothetical protein